MRETQASKPVLRLCLCSERAGILIFTRPTIYCVFVWVDGRVGWLQEQSVKICLLCPRASVTESVLDPCIFLWKLHKVAPSYGASLYRHVAYIPQQYFVWSEIYFDVWKFSLKFDLNLHGLVNRGIRRSQGSGQWSNQMRWVRLHCTVFYPVNTPFTTVD